MQRDGMNLRARPERAAERTRRPQELVVAWHESVRLLLHRLEAKQGSLGVGGHYEVGAFEVSFTIPSYTLRPNSYSIELSLFVPHQYVIETLNDILVFTVFDAGTKYAQSEGTDYGVVFPPCETSVRRIALDDR